MTFSVTISGGSPTINYTWQRNTGAGWADIVGDADITYPAEGSMKVKDIGSLTNPGGTLYRVVVSDAAGFVLTSNPATMTVNRVLTMTPANVTTTICEGGTATFSATTQGETPSSYQWKKYPGGSNVIDGGSISGATTTALTFTNAKLTDAGEYKLQVLFPTCTTTSRISRYLVVNPVPVLTAPTFMCVGNNYNLLPATGGAWTSSNTSVATIDNSGLVTAVAPGVVNFTFTITATGCSSTTGDINVYPVPDVVATPTLQTLCSGGTTSIALSSAVTGTAFSWTVVQSGVSGASDGNWGKYFPNPYKHRRNRRNCHLHHNTYCGWLSLEFHLHVVITVNPIPTVDLPVNQNVCNNAPTSAVSYTGAVTGTVFNWTNSTPSIGIGASGTGDIPVFTAVNTGTTPVIATFVVTPEFTNAGVTCTGASQTFAITVNPTPDVAANPTTQTICSGSVTSIALTGNVANTIFNWTIVESGVSGATPGAGTNLAQTLATTGNVTGTATYTITPTSNGCPGTAIIVVITVNPVPNVNDPADQVICNGNSTTPVNFTGLVTGTVYNWTNDNTTIGLAATGTGNIAAFTAVNTGTAPQVANITVTPVYDNAGLNLHRSITNFHNHDKPNCTG